MRRIEALKPWIAVAISVAAVGWLAFSQNSGDPLEEGFKDPPNSARPRVWWHWMNGNITKEGIKLDLEWMKRVGIAGFQNFDAALRTPQIVEKRLVYMTPEWKDAFRFTTELADRLGLEMAIAGSPGWSETGGPWVEPSQAMKKYVWSRTIVEGGHPFSGVLPKPPSVSGPFQNIPGGGEVAALLGHEEKRPEYYADSAVVAFGLPETDLPLTELHPKVSSSGGSFDLTALTDGDMEDATPLPAVPPDQEAWIQFEFPEPQTVHALTVSVRNLSRNRWRPLPDSGQELEAGDDGVHFRPVVKIPADGAVVNTVAFDPVTARYFRVTFKTLRSTQGPGTDIPGFNAPAPPKTHDVAELALHTGARVNRFEDKAGFSTLLDLYPLATPPVVAGDVVEKGSVVDLTGKMHPDGTLEWKPPAGRWIVLRIGYSLLGITNHPASPEATGLEVDKLNREDVKAYFETYLDHYEDATGGLMGKRGLQYVITDSYEAGPQNWTDDMIAEFNRRRGYDMHPWLPVLAGYVVESAEASDRFLWDFRKTLGELIAEYHYDEIGELLHARGMGRYTESHESGRAFIGDGMDVKRHADIPMSATWTPTGRETEVRPSYNADVRESASVAHIYGQNLVAAESLTAIGTAWQWSPETLKPTADRELSNGLNRFVIHTSVHQPVTEKKPGLGLGPFGQWFTRLETWAELAGPWIDYLSRSSYMLQQGRFVADIAYFYGEDSNITALFGSGGPNLPGGYNFDYVSPNALLHQLSVRDGRLTTPSGMSYRLLVLDPNSRHMSLPVLRKIRELVDAGAAVCGDAPIDDPSLADDPAEFRTIIDQLWGSARGPRKVGAGTVYAGMSAGDALQAMDVPPDFEYSRPAPDTQLLFVHRALPEGDLYWVDNRSHRKETLDVTFRVDGREAELWDPKTGDIEPAGYRIEGDRTTVPFRLDPEGTVFVVFRKPATTSSRTLPFLVEHRLATIEGPWQVSFPPDLGAPPTITLDRLGSWSENSDPGVKYFSGTATYSRTVEASADWLQDGTRLWLDLGDVKNLAQVSVNGESLGIVWKRPFRVDVTEVLKPGTNQLEVKVTNLWVNRLIGDQQPDATRKYTYTTMPFYQADSPLLPSGLLGPVRLIGVEHVAASE